MSEVGYEKNIQQSSGEIIDWYCYWNYLWTDFPGKCNECCCPIKEYSGTGH